MIPAAAVPGTVGEPRLIKASTYICIRCRKSMGRLPVWNEYLDKGDCCRRCGGTSFHYKECRPFGPRSRLWPEIIKEWHMYYELSADSPYWRAELLASLAHDATERPR